MAEKAPVTGLSASTGSSPGEIDVAWDAHPEGALEYRVAWAPSGESFRGAGNTDWNAYPTDTSLTITGLQRDRRRQPHLRAGTLRRRVGGGTPDRSVPLKRGARMIRYRWSIHTTQR